MNSRLRWSAFMNELHDMSCMTCYMKFQKSDRKSCCIGSLRKCCHFRMCLIFDDSLIFCIPVSLTATVYQCSRQLWLWYIKMHAMQTCCQKLAMCSTARSEHGDIHDFFYYYFSVVVWICPQVQCKSTIETLLPSLLAHSVGGCCKLRS